MLSRVVLRFNRRFLNPCAKSFSPWVDDLPCMRAEIETGQTLVCWQVKPSCTRDTIRDESSKPSTLGWLGRQRAQEGGCMWKGD